MYRAGGHESRGLRVFGSSRVFGTLALNLKSLGVSKVLNVPVFQMTLGLMGKLLFGNPRWSAPRVLKPAGLSLVNHTGLP